MSLHNPFDRREADAAPLKFRHGVQSVERIEELLGMSHIKTDAVVADEIGRHPLVLDDAEFDSRARAFLGELPGIAEQVLQHDF